MNNNDLLKRRVKMEITKIWLKKNNACFEGIEYCEQEKLIGLPVSIFAEKLIEANKLAWANWLVARALERVDKVRYAVYAAETVLPIYEKKYQDDRPRKAIAAAKAYIEHPCAAVTCVTADAANTAFYAAVYTAAAAADAAAYAARVAADAAADTAADAAADTAAYAARAAACAADAAACAAAGNFEYIKIINFGINLLKED